MIRLDLMKNINPSLLSNNFLNNREGIDPELYYRVGKINEEIVVWNTSTNLLMDYYYDDSNEEWFQIPGFENYKINRSGEVFGPRKKLSKLFDIWGYPVYKMAKKHKKIHYLLAIVFIPNINADTKKVIDHIDRNKDNYNLSNLRWATVKENANNMTRHSWSGVHVFRKFKDRTLTDLECSFTDEQLWEKYKDDFKTTKSRIWSSFRTKSKFENGYWTIEDTQVTDYLKEFSILEIDESLWKEHYSKEFLVHPTGLLKFKNGMLPFLGAMNAKNGTHPERRFHHKGRGLRVHVLVAEVFLNNNKPIGDSLVIDHINTNSLDNRVENLRICTQSENMSNPITVEKLSRKVLAPNGKTYISISECAKDYGVTIGAIWARLNGRRPSKGFKYI